MIVLKAAQAQVLEALQSVAGIVERRHTLPILANVLLRKNGDSIEFTTSDLEIQVRTHAALGGDAGQMATTVGARKLIDILRALPADQVVTLSSAQNKLTLQGGKSRFTLQTLPADDFPLVNESVDFGPTFSVPQKTLRDLVNQVHFAMAVHDIRYYLNGILFIAEGRTLTLVATDGHRLALGQAQLAAEVPSKQEVILPRKTVLELQRLLKDEETPIEMRFANNQAKFSFSGMEFVTKLVEGKFPDYNRVIPTQPQEFARAGPSAAAGLPAARRHPDEREVQGRARQPRAGAAAHRLEQCRAGRGQGRARGRLRRRRHRHRLQRHLPHRRAGQHEPGDGQARAAGQQCQRADQRARPDRLQVRRDADEDLTGPRAPL